MCRATLMRWMGSCQRQISMPSQGSRSRFDTLLEICASAKTALITHIKTCGMSHHSSVICCRICCLGQSAWNMDVFAHICSRPVAVACHGMRSVLTQALLNLQASAGMQKYSSSSARLVIISVYHASKDHACCLSGVLSQLLPEPLACQECIVCAQLSCNLFAGICLRLPASSIELV